MVVGGLTGRPLGLHTARVIMVSHASLPSFMSKHGGGPRIFYIVYIMAVVGGREGAGDELTGRWRDVLEGEH